jgi:cold-inducible RNA-binding protein
MKKLFVGSLSFNTTESELDAAFNRFGKITEAKVITDRMTGRSRGFGFVTFETDEAAQAAMSEMDGTSLDGRTITVNEAQEQRRDGGGRGGPRGGGGGGGGPRGGGNRDRNW